jgi:hypothetical protein
MSQSNKRVKLEAELSVRKHVLEQNGSLTYNTNDPAYNGVQIAPYPGQELHFQDNHDGTITLTGVDSPLQG